MDMAVSVSNLTYSHSTAAQPSLLDINLHLPQGSRTILVGANGGRPKPFILQALLTQLPSWEVYFVANLGREKAGNDTRR
ncbi:hypothetical protein L208DRAFT_39103 [Tricholoma matsutake]|nr:hypothetical protein L208DRAFT_39103 [Tricholoma matsutake 945]